MPQRLSFGRIKNNIFFFRDLLTFNIPQITKATFFLQLIDFFFILLGQVEKDYWGKIMKDREDKISGKIKVSNGPKKQRGKDRIIKKFHEMQQKENAHKYFNEGDEDIE